MERQYCYGRDARSGEAVEVRFTETIEGVDPLVGRHRVENWISPGWIDLQVNGFSGVDYCSPSTPAEEIGRSVRELFATGVTRLFPTVITGTTEGMVGAIRNLARAKATLGLEGRALEGFHIEGPHISAEEGPRGAHPVECVRPPDVEELKAWIEASEGNVRLVTVSPEWEGINRYIEYAVSRGIVVSIGHTKATSAQIAEAVEAGATMSTHLGNGAHAVLARHPNYIWDQLAEDRLTASFIVDGIHLSPAFVKAAVRAKGVERSVLVTDAVMPAGCRPGAYKLGEVEVELREDDRVTLRGSDRLAGSSLKLDRGIANVMRFAGLSLGEALATVTRNPARVGRISGRQRGLEVGERADLVEFQFDATTKAVTVEAVYLDGEQVYARG